MPSALVVLATCLAANALLGPLGAGIIQWHVSAIGINQTYGADAVLMLVAVLPGISWTAQPVPITLTDAVAPEYLDSPSAFWTIRDVDPGFIVPVAIWTSYGLWQGVGGPIKAGYALASFLTMQGASVFAMGLVMLWRQHPTASPAFFTALTPIVVAMAVLTAKLLASYSQFGPPLRRHEA